MWYSTSLVTVEMHLETGLHFGPSWIRRIWRSFLVRWISNFGTVNFGTPQHSRNHSNHSFNRLTIVSKVVITFESWKLTSRLLELSKANRFYISERGPFWETLGLLRNSLSIHTSFEKFRWLIHVYIDVDDGCWWQLWDVGDGFCRFCHQHPLIT